MAHEGKRHFIRPFLPKTQNFVKDIVTHGCARPWYVYVETFAPAFIIFLITVAFLQLDDLIRMRGESLVRKGGSRKGIKGRHIRFVRAPVRETKAQRFTRTGLKTLLILTTPAEIAGFAYLLYSAGDKFFGNWQALLEQSSFCEQPIESGPLTKDQPNARQSILPGGAAVFLNRVRQNRANWTHTAINADIPQGFITAIFALTIKGALGGLTDVFVRFRVVRGPFATFFDGDKTNIAQDEWADLMVKADFFLPGIAGGVVGWELVGPAVPIGVETKEAFATFQRTG